MPLLESIGGMRPIWGMRLPGATVHDLPRLLLQNDNKKYFFFSLLVIYMYTIFMGDTMYYLYLFIQAVRPVSHYAILMFQLGLMISVNVI